jgi:hypothetical protein
VTDALIDAPGGRIRIARSRGAFSGILLVLLGAWGALAPLAGPYWHFGFTPDDTWNLTDGRWWFEVLPGIAAALGGLLLIVGTDRISASLGGWLAVAAGGWYVVGPTLQPTLSLGSTGSPIHPSVDASTVERLTLFGGLGALIILVGAWALGALTVVGVRDVRHARTRAVRREELADAAATDTEIRGPRAIALPSDDEPQTVVMPLSPTHARIGGGEDSGS